jgi:peptidoglycan/LPS O-acetylase OafA/YrhL
MPSSAEVVAVRPPLQATDAPAAAAAAAERRIDVDAVRLVASVMVVLYHAGATFVIKPEAAHSTPGISYWLALVIEVASRSAVTVFFCIAGWAFLSKSRVAPEANEAPPPAAGLLERGLRGQRSADGPG